MAIKLLSSNELKIVQDLAHAIWPDTFKDILSSDQIKYMLNWMYDLETLKKQADNGQLFFLYTENNQPVGFMGIEPFYLAKSELKIHKIYVLPQTQGSGIGKKLIEKAISVAKENNIEKLLLNVNRFNKAVTFYQHLKFTIEYEENIDIGNGFWMEDFVMNYKL